jgi:hypothetical protein
VSLDLQSLLSKRARRINAAMVVKADQAAFFRSFGSRKELNERFVFLASCLREMPRPSASSFVKFSK